ncbi:beta strand repeat-containing protein, partial [Helicobacter pullorum]|uniref:beta strand repeat-containing protein n=1 Tax=Helicobacter pullorum TaxID=35818 RepID=UPI0015CF0E2C
LNNQSLETKNPKNAKSLDSNSKTNKALESQNPNKIQTAKIQSPKVSKDLVNPQSPKVLESNLKLDSKNTRESKKIQRVKNTSNSITIQNPTNSQKSKESSKAKSFIRTIPISIALASALTSHAVAAWQFGNKTNGSGGGILTGYGTIVSQDIIVENIQANLTSQNVGILNFLYGITQNGSGGNLTINNNSSLTIYVLNGPLIRIYNNAVAGIITNSGTLIREQLGGVNNYPLAFSMQNNARAEAFINNGRMYWERAGAIGMQSGTNIGIIKNTGTIQSGGDAINANGATIGSIELNGGLIQRINNSGGVGNVVPTTGNIISLTNSTKVGTITMSNSASIHGNTSLLTHSTITNGFSIDNSKITGNITLANQSTIANGLSLSNTANITGVINLTERGYIDVLSLNQGTITGGISLTGNANGTDTNTATIGEITLENASTITGDISVKGDGASNNANAKIGNIILEDGTGIGGSIAVGDSNGAANTNGEIAGITLNGNSTITNGITNASGGTISNITLASSNTINNGIANEGNIGTITSNTGTNVNNT